MAYLIIILLAFALGAAFTMFCIKLKELQSRNEKDKDLDKNMKKESLQ
ncbi:MAG: hypothetical protein IJH92_08025 [Mogibacterium sp.]|nr:hypothetical protein [Mogibacterium sp.]